MREKYCLPLATRRLQIAARPSQVEKACAGAEIGPPSTPGAQPFEPVPPSRGAWPAAALLGLPGCSLLTPPVPGLQLSERTELMVECLERLQRSMQDPPAVRGDPAWFREQIRDNSLRLAELEKLGVSLETLRGQGAELLATVQSSANQGMPPTPPPRPGQARPLS